MNMSCSDPTVFHGLIKHVTAEYERVFMHNAALSAENTQLRSQLGLDSNAVKPRDGLDSNETTATDAKPFILEQQFWHGVPPQTSAFPEPLTPQGSGRDGNQVQNVNHSQDQSESQEEGSIIQLRRDAHGGSFRESSAGPSAAFHKCLEAVNYVGDILLDGHIEEESCAVSIHDEASGDDIGDKASDEKSIISAPCCVKRLHFRMKHCFEVHFHLLSEPLVHHRVSTSMDAAFPFKEMVSMEDGGYWKGCKSFGDGLGETNVDMCMIHPFSRLRLVWGVSGFALLLFDLIFVPIDSCFDVKETEVLAILQFIARSFWTLDIFMSFLTGIFEDGRLVMLFPRVAKKYLRTWFPFDMFLVSVEWIAFWLIAEGGSSPFSVFRAFRGSRLVRLLRMLRFIKFQKLRPWLRDFVIVSTKGMDALLNALKTTLAGIVFLHLFGCVWYLYGNRRKGWVEASGLEHASMPRKYFLSLHWILMGEDVNVRIDSTEEYAVSVILSVFILMYMGFYIGMWTNMVTTWAHSDASEMHIVAAGFIKKHAVRYHLSQRIIQCLTTLQFGGASEVLANEKRLKQCFPELLRMDVNYEVRWRIAQGFPLLADLHTYNPRCVRSLCHEAMTEMLGVSGETIFALGDFCTSMYIVCFGSFTYTLFYTTSEEPADTPSFHLHEGDVISEPSLWTHWEHLGNLTSREESIFISIDAAKFAEVCMEYSRPKVHVVKYAQHFCWRLSRTDPSDVISFSLPVRTLDQVLHIGGIEDHFVFLSHYKVEAGTEATLMRDELEAMVRKDQSNPAGQFAHPIFIDSENLVDLRRLVNHAEGSLALVLLLSPGLLTRPWCLLEIVTAKRCHRPFVPVLLHRPGLHYEFPNEEFYRKLHRDEIVDGGAKGRRLLQENGVEMEEVEAAIRAVFLMIALPYSPHKSAGVRKAELRDILKRCMIVTKEALRKLGLDDGDHQIEEVDDEEKIGEEYEKSLGG